MEKILKFILALVLMLLPLLIKAADCDDLYREGIGVRRTLTVVAQNKAISLFEQARDCYDLPADKDKCEKQIRICVATIERLGGTPVLNANGQNDSPASISYQPEEVPGENPVQAASEPVDTAAIIHERPAPPVDEPVVEEPVSEEPAVEEPEVEAPVVEEPAVETKVAPQPVDTVPAAEEPETPVQAPLLTVDQEFEFAAKNPEPQEMSLSADGNWTFNGLQPWVKYVHEGDTLTITVEPNTGKKRTCTFLVTGTGGAFRITVVQKEYKKFGIF